MPHGTIQVAEDRVELLCRAWAKAQMADSTGTGPAVPRSIDDEDRETWGAQPGQATAMRSLMGISGAPVPVPDVARLPAPELRPLEEDPAPAALTMAGPPPTGPLPPGGGPA